MSKANINTNAVYREPTSTHYGSLPPTGFLSANELLALPCIPFKRSTLWKWVKEGKFPDPVRICKLTRWRCEDVHAWLAQFNPQEQSNV